MKSMQDNPIYLHIKDNVQDAVLFKANVLLELAGDDIHQEDKAISDIAQMISYVESEFIREEFANKIHQKHKKFKAASILKRINGFVKERDDKVQQLAENERALPSWINKEKFYTIGFDSKTDGIQNTGIYFHMGEKGARQLTNFVITPLIHVYSKDENQNRRLTEVNNGITKTVLELPSKAFTSVDQFESILMNEGVFFLMDGFTKAHLNKMKSQFLREYPKCFELKTLGWQPEGFWAYSNKIYSDSLCSFNEYGYVEINGTNYLSMAASSIHNDVRAEDDIYKNDRFLQWSLPAIDFKEWAKMVAGAYGENGHFGIMFCFISLFRDIVFALNSSCPHLYVYGQVQSGKSKFAETLSNLFFKEMPFFNLNQGTDYAFFNRLERFRNCPVGFNEFDENAIKEEWFRVIKAAFDGEGREKGSMTRKKKTETQEILCAIILIGQFLSTKDDASVLSRTIPLKITPNGRTTEQIEHYDRLKAYEKVGLGGILVELLQHRKLMESKYPEVYRKEFKKLGQAFEAENIKVKARIHSNFCTVLTMRAVLDGKLQFPFSYDQFFSLVKQEIIRLSQQISESDSLAAFWKTMEFMLDQEMIEDGWDFKIEAKDEIPLMISRSEIGEDGKNTRIKKFAEPKKLIFLRLTTIHPLYMNAMRQQTGKTGLNQETIVTYMRDLDSFVGVIKSTSFKNRKGKGTVSNAYVLDYDLLNANLERFQEPMGEDRTIEGEVRYRNAEIIDVMGVGKLTWIMEDDKSYEKDGQTIKNIVTIKCYSEQLQYEAQMVAGAKIKVLGKYREFKSRDTMVGEMMAAKIEFVSSIPVPVPAVDNQESLPF
ncbi:hypothetical protein ACR79B_11060 [Sphingobacterium spiritivorum]|uniref:hypothetical protein n=1 Tax=Sphingobacterium spiritivorum TaxID=258 RepID=UPI003DA57114